MGLDETNLQVLMVSGTPKEQAHAATVLKLLSRGKHWVLGKVVVDTFAPLAASLSALCQFALPFFPLCFVCISGLIAWRERDA